MDFFKVVSLCQGRLLIFFDGESGDGWGGRGDILEVWNFGQFR